MVQDVGITPYMNMTVGRYNIDSSDLRLMLEYSKDNRYTTLINVATPGGMWSELASICVNEEDTNHLIEMRKYYKNMLRNLWDPFDRNREGVIGCNTIIVLYYAYWRCSSLPYVHIKVGNVLTESLKDISNRGFRIKKFRDYSKNVLRERILNLLINIWLKRGLLFLNQPN